MSEIGCKRTGEITSRSLTGLVADVSCVPNFAWLNVDVRLSCTLFLCS